MPDWVPPRASGDWLTREEMTSNTWGHAPGRLFLGTLPDDESVIVGRADDRHVVTIAGSRAGKSTTALLPNLRSWPGSTLVIDPKGELARIAGPWREKFGRTVILDPFNVTGQRANHGWNPFDELRGIAPELIPDEAATIAEALIVEDGRGDSHWPAAARNLVRGLIMHFVSLNVPFTLTELRRALASGPTLTGFLEQMSESEGFNGIVASLGASLLATGERERGSIVSMAATQSSFLDSPGIGKVSSRSTFRLSDFLGPQPISVFLVLPSGRMPTHYRWLRLFVTMALTAMEQAHAPPPSPVLWMLEEFAQLGHMRSLQSAAGYMAGFGVKLWIVLQDLPQLKAHYQDSWETFLGNAGLVQAFGNTDPSTLQYLSTRLGEVDVELPDSRHVSASGLRQGDFGSPPRHERRPLLSPSEIERAFPREARNALILAAGQKPLVLNRVHWEQLS